MELEAWLAVYQAVSRTAAAKERLCWLLTALFLSSNALLLLPAGFLAASFPGGRSQPVVTGLAVLGAVVSVCWLLSGGLAAREKRHWESLARSVEQQFAGAEFHRSAYRLLRGEETCVPTTAWKCGEWYPDVERLGWAWRSLPCLGASLLPLAFLAAWAALIVATWAV